MRAKIEPGTKCGLLTVLEHVNTKKTNSVDGKRIHYDPVVKCVCRCGTIVLKYRRYIRNGHGQQCGSEDCRRMARWLVRESKKQTVEFSTSEGL